MFEAIRRNPSRQRVSGFANVPAPIGGWDQSARSKEGGIELAFEMENFIPEMGRITLRRGSEAHATGIAGEAETLMEWSFGGSSKLFAAADGNIYDVTSSGTVGSAAVSSLTNDRWQYVNFSTTGGNFLVAVNGADGVHTYSGSAWATQTLTTIPAEEVLVHVFAHKERLWFTEINSLSVWYLASRAISGAATELDLGSVFERGGYLVGGASWTRDGGAGMDDVAVFLTSEGEVAIYEGTDPSSASTWALVGVYQIDRPIGRRCMENVGADLVVLTVSGIYPLSQVLAAGSPQQIIPEAVRDAFLQANAEAGSAFGWQLVNYKKKGWVFINIPFGGGAQQYAINTVTRKWFYISGWDAKCWGTLDGDIYFGTTGAADLSSLLLESGDALLLESGSFLVLEGTASSTSPIVVKADTGQTDLGADIVGRFRTGWDDLGTDFQKHLKMVRPLHSASGEFTPLVLTFMDYDDSTPSMVANSFANEEGAEWDVAEWDVASWSTVGTSRNRWHGVNGTGMVASIYYECRLQNIELSISGFDILYERGAVL